MKTNKDSLQNKKEVITKGWFIGLEEIKSDISSYSESILTVFTFLLTSIIIKPNPDIFKQIPILRLVIIIAIVLLVYFMCKKNCLNNKLAKYFEKEEFEFFWWRNSWPIFLIISAVSFILWISTIGIWKKANIFFWFSFLVLLFYCIINFFINKKGNVDDGEEKMKKDKKFIREVSRFLELLEGNYGKNIPNQELKDKFGKDYERIIAYLTVQGGRGRLILRNSKSCKLNDASLDKIRSFISDINKHRLDEAHIITNVVLTFAIFVIALIGTLISTLEVTTSERAPTLFKISLVIIWGAFVASLLFLIKKLPK